MKILFLSNSDINGGAARAAFRIFESLNENGFDVKMLVKNKLSTNKDVLDVNEFTKGFDKKINIFNTKIQNKLYKYKLNKYDIKKEAFISNLSSISLVKALKNIDFDILHLHWISHQFLNLNELKSINKPIVWTLHDCWAFTGICHYFDDCNNYTSTCGCCPILNSKEERDLSQEIWKKKSNVYKTCNIHVVTPSKWLGDCASKSSLFKDSPISVIPYPINTLKFAHIDKEVAKSKLGLNRHKNYILFGAMNATQDNRKGFNYFSKSFEYFNTTNSEDYEILIFGSRNSEIEYIKGFRVRYLGNIEDDLSLVYAYNSADVVVTPSLSENLSLVIMESLSCGTPVVAFNVGGNSDMIIHQKNGYLALPYSAEDLATGIEWCFKNNTDNLLSTNSQNKIIENFSMSLIAEKYRLLYQSL